MKHFAKTYILTIKIFILIGCSPNSRDREQKTKVIRNDSISSLIKLNIQDTVIILNETKYEIKITKKIKEIDDNSLVITEVLLQIKKNDNVYYEKLFRKDQFGITDTNFLTKADLYNFSFDKHDKQKNEFEFFCAIGLPESDWSYAYEIFIDKSGKEKVIELPD